MGWTPAQPLVEVAEFGNYPWMWQTGNDCLERVRALIGPLHQLQPTLSRQVHTVNKIIRKDSSKQVKMQKTRNQPGEYFLALVSFFLHKNCIKLH